MSLGLGLLTLAGFIWLGLLFAVALIGERAPDRFRPIWPVVYSLSLAVYCTAWTFYGVTTQITRAGWPIPPTFLGTILIFAFGWRFLQRLVALSKQHNSTSIADFIATRFGKSSVLAAVVTTVAVLGAVPYIALQLKAVAMSFGALTTGSGAAEPAAWQDLAFYIAVAMSLFAVLFGTRRASAVEHNRGLVLAMSFESLFKLSAMIALGLFVLFGLFDGPGDWNANTPPLQFQSGATFITLTLLGALAMFTLPHQFHIGVVECRDAAHLRTARWLFPLFLILIGLPILPLARAGEGLLGGQVPSDLYVLMLPLDSGHGALALFAFLGGLSAATGMVILAGLALSIMIGNHWLTPVVLRLRGTAASEQGIPVRLQRRAGIVMVVLLAYAYSRVAGGSEALADIGALSFSGLAQLAPAVVLAVYRPGLDPRALLAGLLAGVLVWAYVLLLPLLVQPGPPPGWFGDGPLGLGWLAPNSLLGLDGVEALPRAVIASLLINLLLITLVQRFAAPPRAQPAAVGAASPQMLHDLAERFLPPERVAPLFRAPRQAESLEADVEHELAAVVGAASARLLLDAARKRAPAPLETVADLVGTATEQARFSREVLSGALENMSQGICVVDDQMRLVAWNQAYLDLFDYPEDLIRVGRPVSDLLRHNAERGLIDGGHDIEARIQRRLAHKRAGTRHHIERPWPDGRIIEIRGNPMPGGGFVATFTDVTAFRSAQRALEDINQTLEQRVEQRTTESEAARRAAEQANAAKSRFLAAVSHDLVQPLNAAQLMTHSLLGKIEPETQRQALHQISGALGATEDLLGSLLDISRLDAGGLEPRITGFALNELFEQLAGEFALLAQRRGLQLRWRATRIAVESDPQLLRRILQNFLSNAIRYTRSGGVLLGARRRSGQVLVGVWDTGPGIPAGARRTIFEEFRRLEPDQGAPGLGLGLAIAERMARLLEHELVLESEPGRGTLFGVSVPLTRGPTRRPPATSDTKPAAGARVLLVDNDARMLASLASMLGDWGLQIETASAADHALTKAAGKQFDLLMLDYHLDAGQTGLDLLGRLREIGQTAPALLISADHASDLKHAAHAAGCELLHKPIRPLALRSMLRRVLE